MPKSWLDRIELMLVFMLSGFVFWPNAVPSICLISILGLRIIQQRKSAFPNGKEWWLLLPLLAILVSWIGFRFPQDGMRELQLWATWLAAFIYFKSSPYKSHFAKGFIFFSFAQATFVLAYFTLAEPLSNAGFSQSFRDTIEQVFHLHPTFLSTAWMLAAFLAIAQLNIHWRNQLLIAGVLILMAIFSGGRMPVIAGFMVLTVFNISKIQSLKHKVLASAFIGTFFMANVLFNPLISQRFDELKTLSTNYTEGQLLTSTQLRLGIWKCSWLSIQDHWLIGVGTGNTREILEACYHTYQQVEFFDTEFNTHNQFMHFWLTGGIFSFLALIIFFGLILRKAWRKKNYDLLYFCLFIGLIFLTENYFSRQFGMMFTSFFLFSLHYRGDHIN